MKKLHWHKAYIYINIIQHIYVQKIAASKTLSLNIIEKEREREKKIEKRRNNI